VVEEAFRMSNVKCASADGIGLDVSKNWLAPKRRSFQTAQTGASVGL
jgi:hypothetical protein